MSKSNDNGRAFEYCLTYVILSSRPNLLCDVETKQQQYRDQKKYEELSVDQKLGFEQAALKYLEVIKLLDIKSIRRLPDSEGKKGNPTDIELILKSGAKKNISLKNNHDAVKHQRPGTLIKQLGIVDSYKEINKKYRHEIQNIEEDFYSRVELMGFDLTKEHLFADIKAKDAQVILELYRSICNLVIRTINRHSFYASTFFRFLVSSTDFDKVIFQQGQRKLIIQKWEKLLIPCMMNADRQGDSYVKLCFNNGFSFLMRLHTASGKFKKGRTLSLKFDTRLYEVGESSIPSESFYI